MSTPAPASRGRILCWGFTLRCPRCGSGHLFRCWFHIERECPRCSLVFEREAGYWIGAMAINMAATTGVLAVAFIVAIALTLPDVPVAELLAAFIPLGVITPIVLFPFSKTIWMAVDRGILQRLDARERPDEQVRKI
ncbi:MAG: DUF983 domain-containing protein [Actinobacteria bacterium]|nr:DUF983 domain-containing protein [Actinomycetota bacterium]